MTENVIFGIDFRRKRTAGPPDNPPLMQLPEQVFDFDLIAQRHLPDTAPSEYWPDGAA